MGGLYVLVLAFTAIGALLSIPIFYLWAWSMGPAVKYLGGKWEEGREEARERWQGKIKDAELKGRQDGYVIGIQEERKRLGYPQDDKTTASTADAGHRWLGEPRKP